MKRLLKKCKSGLFCVIFGLAVMGVTSTINGYSNYDPLGPARYPMLLGMIITVLGAMLCLPPYQDKEDESDDTRPFLSRCVKLFGVIGCCCFYIIFFDKLGFVITNVLTLMGCTAILGERKIWKMLLFSVIASVVLYVLFKVALGILLPPVPFLNI